MAHQSYTKLTISLTVAAVVAWLFLVFVAWKVLKSRKKKACDKGLKHPCEKPGSPIKAKDTNKRPLRFELSGKKLSPSMQIHTYWRRLRELQHFEIAAQRSQVDQDVTDIGLSGVTRLFELPNGREAVELPAIPARAARSQESTSV